MIPAIIVFFTSFLRQTLVRQTHQSGKLG